MAKLYRRYEVRDDIPVSFVGVHPLKWRTAEWGLPDAMFAETDIDDTGADEPELVVAIAELERLSDDK
jgi:hypothetical protein